VDNSTGQPLNITYNIPLNESVTWLSVLWINRGMFVEELQIIVDGTVMQDRYLYNMAYTTWKDTYSSAVFNAIVYVNQNLPFVSSTALTTFWNNLTTTYNLTSTELTFIQNNRQIFMDNLTFNMIYSGVQGLNMTVTDPKNGNVINLNFPGNVIQRTSQIVYCGSIYEGVKSFAIATTDVTNNILQYWWNQRSSYQTDAMNAAYTTFVTALMVEYIHDQIADNITTTYNVNWSRTSPIVVSACEDTYETYLTLECDHSMGMTVVGIPENIIGFNYECSSAISSIEYTIMSNASNNSNIDSVALYLVKAYLFSSTSVEMFEQNDFIIEKSVLSNDNFIVTDLRTGIVRDINTVNNLCGVWDQSSNVQSIYQVSVGFLENDNTVNDVRGVGSATFWWDGIGDVILSNGDNSIWADDELIITGPNGTETLYYGGIYSGPGVSITNLLTKDEATNNVMPNVVQISVKNLYPSKIGCSALSLYLMGGTQLPNILSLPDFISDLLGGRKQINREYFKQWAVAAFCYVKLSVDIGSLFNEKSLVEGGTVNVMPLWEKVDALNSLEEDNNNYQDACAKLKNMPVFINGTC
jgi:hypothetical protein